MADANLLSSLRDNSKLNDIVIFGKVRCAIEKPSFLSSKVRLLDGFYVLIDVLALQCKGVDYFGGNGSYDGNHIYFSKGSIVSVINNKDLIGKNVRIFGKNKSTGCTIKKQSTNTYKDGIVSFVWRKDGGDWCIACNTVVPFGVSEVRGTILQEYLSIIAGEGTFNYPDSIDSIVEYAGVMDYKPLDLNNIKGSFDYSDEEVDISQIPLNLVHRLESAPESAFMEAIEEEVEIIKGKIDKYNSELNSYIKEGNTSDIEDIALNICERFIPTIGGSYNFVIGQSKIKGREFVDDMLDSVLDFRYSSSDDTTLTAKDKESLFRKVEDIKKQVPLNPNVLHPYQIGINGLSNIYHMAGRIIGELTGVGVEKIVNNHNRFQVDDSNKKLEEWFWCLCKNPYICGLKGSGLNLYDCDRIFFFMRNLRVDVDAVKGDEIRSIMMMLDKISGYDGKSTLIEKNRLLSGDMSYSSLGLRFIQNYGNIYSLACGEAIKLFLGKAIIVTSEDISVETKRSELLNIMTENGLIDDVNGYVILSNDLYKEFFVYSKLYKKGCETTGVTDEQIEETIRDFEAGSGFKLEALQKDGVHLVKYKAGVLSGCAGSGKTTTSDRFVEVIRKYLKGYKVRFGAPTGKAARRLAEVVGGDVKTIHSMFGLGLGGEPYLKKWGNENNTKNKEGIIYAYILDEMAMANMNLMYNIVKNLEDGDIVYFLGDIKQLPSIGKGSPFRALMKFLPCVELGVSKRAAANGKINYNCGMINFASDDKMVELQPGDDFKIIPCADSDIQRKTIEVFKEALTRYQEDDIQVVTGYQTDRYPWATVNLNPLIQEEVRDTEKEYIFTYINTKFMRNDRVIHVKRNAYDMPRFRLLEDGTFEEVITFGVVNGELGKVVGVIRSDKAKIVDYEVYYSEEEYKELDYDMQKLVELRESKESEIRKESELQNENVYFVVVMVYDVNLNEDVVVLYRAHYREEANTDFDRVFTGGDLGNLELAYALTTHKMQGSQNPMIIIPLGSSSSPDFINRNMLNTMITRASKEVVLIGSVRGRDSALSNGRRKSSTEEGEDFLNLIADEV